MTRGRPLTAAPASASPDPSHSPRRRVIISTSPELLRFSGISAVAKGMLHPVVTPDEEATLASLQARITDPSRGLPDPVFQFALGLVPMINVDLFVVDGTSRALWAWRDDEFGAGWHIPGGIIRFGETAADRIASTAAGELGTAVVAEAAPRAIAQFSTERGCFISLIYRCHLQAADQVTASNQGNSRHAGELRWFAGMPTPVYPPQHFYDRLLAPLTMPEAGPLIMASDERSASDRPGDHSVP